MDQGSPTQLGKSDIDARIDKRLHQWQMRGYAFCGVLVALMGLFSGLVLWAVQTSGTLAGQLAAKEAVDQKRAEIQSTLDRVGNLREETAQMAGEMRGKLAEVRDLESQHRRAAEKLELAEAFLANNVDQLAVKLAGQPGFAKAAAGAVDKRIRAIDTLERRINQIEARLQADATSLSGIWTHVGVEPPLSCIVLQGPQGFLLLQNHKGEFTIARLSDDHSSIIAYANNRWGLVPGSNGESVTGRILDNSTKIDWKPGVDTWEKAK
jgi:hypothetical protein